MERTNGLRAVAIVLAVIGVLFAIAAVIWFAEPAKSLPGFMGQVDGATVHRTKRGVAAIVVAVVCLGAAGYILASLRTRVDRADL